MSFLGVIAMLCIVLKIEGYERDYADCAAMRGGLLSLMPLRVREGEDEAAFELASMKWMIMISQLVPSSWRQCTCLALVLPRSEGSNILRSFQAPILQFCEKLR